MSSTVYSLDSFLGVFENSITIQWGPHEDEPLIVANKLQNLANALEDFEPALIGARQVLIDDMKDRFAREVNLNGRKWKQRSKVYLKEYKEAGYDKTILRRDDYLYDAVTDPESYEIVANDLLINTSNWPEYWRAHNEGNYVGRNSKLPKREFVGMSLEARFEVVSVFDHWLLGNLDIIWAPLTGTAMFRGAFGQFGGKVTTGMLHPRLTRESVATIIARPL